MKKILSIIIVAVIITTMSLTAFATDLTHSVGSVVDDAEIVVPVEPVGKDNTQNKGTEYQIAVSDSTSTSEIVNKSVEVYATQSSTYSVKVPKTIVLNGENGNGAYRVAVKGNISGNQTINVVPQSTFALKEQAETDVKADITATVSQNKTVWTTSEIDNTDWTNQDAEISASLTAGIWKGNLAFTVELVNAA